MPAAGAETLAACDPVPARYDDRLRRGGRGVGHHAARRIDPDRARHLVRHAGGVGRKNAALVDHPGGAGIRFAKLLDHLDIGGQVDLGTAQGAWQRHMEHPGVRQGLEERPWELTLGLDRRGVGLNLGANVRATSSSDAVVVPGIGLLFQSDGDTRHIDDTAMGARVIAGARAG